MAYDETLASRIRAALAGSVGITEKRMFGGLAFLKHGHMFVGVTEADLMARVGKDAYAASLARKHVREMDFTGKPMVGYVFIDGQGLAKDAELAFWVKHCEQFASSLPPKSPAKPVAKQARRKSAA